jgi:hypothetical protein
MSDTVSPIEYAPQGLELPSDGLLRHIIAWAAIVYGGDAVIGAALHVALAKGWAASPPSMSWSLDGEWDAPLMAAQTLAMSALLIGGVLMLRRSRACFVVLRASIGCSICLTVLNLVLVLRDNPVYASYWSTPAAAAVNALQFWRGLWLPVLLVLLTLPPFARRMV